LTYFEMLKKFKQKIYTYVFTYYVCTKLFYEKPTCHLAYVKKTNFDAKKKILYHTCFIFFTPRAVSFFRKTFTNAYGLWRCICEIFCLNFLTLRNIIFWHREHMHMGAELNFRSSCFCAFLTASLSISLLTFTKILDPRISITLIPIYSIYKPDIYKGFWKQIDTSLIFFLSF
jgi:hypothetical protein